MVSVAIVDGCEPEKSYITYVEIGRMFRQAFFTGVVSSLPPLTPALRPSESKFLAMYAAHTRCRKGVEQEVENGVDML